MLNLTIFTKLFAKLGYTIFSICDSRLITGDHRIPISCNMFLRATRASSCDATTIKRVIKIFLLACNWSTLRQPSRQLISFKFAIPIRNVMIISLKTLQNL